MNKTKHPSEFEQMVLLAVLQAGDDAYGLLIRRELEARAGRKVSHGAAYVTLERLVKKGYAETWMGEPSAERGGRAKRHFRVTAAGVEALRQSHEAMKELRSGLEKFLEEA